MVKIIWDVSPFPNSISSDWQRLKGGSYAALYTMPFKVSAAVSVALTESESECLRPQSRIELSSFVFVLFLFSVSMW